VWQGCTRGSDAAPLPFLPLCAPTALPACSPAALLQDTAPWWSKVTTTQIVIVLSFTTIIALMISTFFLVLSTGAIRFNE
jgi:hypothetical protein